MDLPPISTNKVITAYIQYRLLNSPHNLDFNDCSASAAYSEHAVLQEMRALESKHLKHQDIKRLMQEFREKIPVLCSASTQEIRDAYTSNIAASFFINRGPLSNPNYSWDRVTMTVVVTAMLAEECLKHGKLQRIRDLIQWCKEIFESWAVDRWIKNNRGGWEQICTDQKAKAMQKQRKLAEEVHPGRDDIPYYGTRAASPQRIIIPEREPRPNIVLQTRQELGPKNKPCSKKKPSPQRQGSLTREPSSKRKPFPPREPNRGKEPVTYGYSAKAVSPGLKPTYGSNPSPLLYMNSASDGEKPDLVRPLLEALLPPDTTNPKRADYLSTFSYPSGSAQQDGREALPSNKSYMLGSSSDNRSSSPGRSKRSSGRPRSASPGPSPSPFPCRRKRESSGTMSTTITPYDAVKGPDDKLDASKYSNVQSLVTTGFPDYDAPSQPSNHPYCFNDGVPRLGHFVVPASLKLLDTEFVAPEELLGDENAFEEFSPLDESEVDRSFSEVTDEKVGKVHDGEFDGKDDGKGDNECDGEDDSEDYWKDAEGGDDDDGHEADEEDALVGIEKRDYVPKPLKLVGMGEAFTKSWENQSLRLPW